MFDLREFILRGLRGSVGFEPEYKIIKSAAGWLDKGVLTESDLAELDSLMNPEAVEIIPEATESV